MHEQVSITPSEMYIHVYIFVLILGLLDLADSYCEAELKKRCERLLWQRVSTDNVAVFLAVAAKYKAEVWSTCATYAVPYLVWCSVPGVYVLVEMLD